MRTRHLLLMLLFGFGVVPLAGAQTPADPSRATANFNWHTPSKLNLHGMPPEDLPADGHGIRFPGNSAWNLGKPTDSESVCYLIRSYRVSRVDRTSDVVCTSWLYGVQS